MIDCVFLLLVYFMVTSTLEKEEADLQLMLPGNSTEKSSLLEIDEQVIEFNGEGQPMLNGAVTDPGDHGVYSTLRGRLSFFRKSAVRAGNQPSLLIVPRENTPHPNVVRVLDAATRAGIESVQFAGLDD